MHNAIFMIEGGKALEMVKQYISEVKRVAAQNKLLAEELGVNEVTTNIRTGVISGVCFKEAIHKDFTKPKKGISYPKKKTIWNDKFKAQIGHRDASTWIAEEFHIPFDIDYFNEKTKGSRYIGSLLRECGFLFISENGPYAMWCPDVCAYVQNYIDQGYDVKEPAKSFKLDFDGCRRIEPDYWKILVLQHKLEKKAVH